MSFWRFDIHERLGTELIGSYNIWLVALSVVFASLAALAALAVVDRVAVLNRRHGATSRSWLLIGAFAMGSGIWAMHFTGMLAYSLPVHMNYSLTVTLLSMLPAMAGSWFALAVMSNGDLPWWRIQIGGLLLAVGIGTMHYTGMEAMILGAEMRYEPWLFALSIVVAHVLATLSLYIRFVFHARVGGTDRIGYRLLSSLMMGCAVAGMHYTAMAAARFYPAGEASVPAMLLPPVPMAILIAVIVLLITGLTMLGAVIDQRLMEASDSVHESATRYKLLLETMADGFITIREDGTIETLNPAGSKMFGRDPEAMVGDPFSELVSSEGHEGALDYYKRTGDVYLIEHRGAVYGRRADGEEFPIDLAFGKMTIRDIELYTCIVRDISEKRTLERQLSHAQKMESIGQLAAGIAHEINTPTQFVSDNTRFLKDAFGDILPPVGKLNELSGNGESLDPRQIYELLSELHDADVGYLANEVPLAIHQCLEGLDRIAMIVRAMKEFSHPATEKSPININQAIESTITVASNEWKYVAQLETDFDPELPLVPCLPGDFNQTILNIIVNAAHAIGEARADSDTKGTIRVSTRHDNDWAEVRIADNGPGIPEQIRNRVFDPFFTTKEVGKGTGQGLSIAHTTIVKKHGGELSVESEIGEGSCFIIRLPLNDEPSADAPAETDTAGETEAGNRAAAMPQAG